MSAKTNVIAIAKPSDPAEALRSERASIIAILEAVARKLARLAETQKDEERIFAEIAKLGESEIEAVKVWVASGCEGPQPQPDAKARRELTERMARGVDATRAAKAVASEVESEAVPLRTRLAQIDSEIRAKRISEFENQFADRVSEFAALASKTRSALLEIRSLPIALGDTGRAAFDRGDEAYARACYATAERMRGNRRAEIEPSEAEIRAAVARLAGRIVSSSEGRSDSPVDPAPSLSPEALMNKVAASNQAENVRNVPDANS